MGSLLAWVGTWLSGGGLGVVGGLAQKLIDAYQMKMRVAQEIEVKKLDNAHEIDMQRENRETMKLEADAKLNVARVEGDTSRAVADTNAMASALASDKRSYATDVGADKYPFMMVLVDFLRGVIRPGLTIYLTIATSVITGVASYHLHQTWLAGQISAVEAKEIVQVAIIQSIKTILFLTEMAVCFWFVTRPTNGKQ